jgi:hypothetical protein
MTPWQILIPLVVVVGLGVAGWGIGKDKGRPVAGFWLGFGLGVIGLIIIALLPRTRQAEMADAQRQYQIQAEAARRAGYPYPPQQPYAPYPYPPQQYAPYPYPPQQQYAPYPPPAQDPYPQQPGQWPYPQQPPPGQQQPPPPPGTWEQQPPATWPGQQQ